jgi:hypothetical protein
MKWIKKYETFVNDDNRAEDTRYPEMNPVIKKEATEYVDSIINSSDYMMMFSVAGVEPPKDLSAEDLDKVFDEVREKAIQHYIQNPEEIKSPTSHKTFKTNGGDGIARTNKVGGTSQAASRIVGESRTELGEEMDITEDEMDLFKKQELLIDLIRQGKVRLSNKKIHFSKSDKETIECLDMYLEMDKKSLKSDN